MFNNPNQNFNPNGGMYPNPMMNPGMNFQYGQRPVPKMTQTLSQEQINKLRNSGATFNLQLSQEDVWRAICTHKDKGQIVLVDNGDGTVTCPICGETFHLDKVSKQDAEAAVSVINDLLQSAKTMFLNIPEEMAAQYFQMIPLIKKLPQLYQMSIDDFNKYDGSGSYTQQNASQFGFNALNNLLSPMVGMGMPGMAGGMPMYQQPQPGMNPAMGGMPMGQQVPQQPMMGGNPFGYYGQQMPMQQQPMMGGQMMPQGQPMMQQQQQAPQQQNQQQAEPDKVTQQKVMSV